jgi:hypothetical protein
MMDRGKEASKFDSLRECECEWCTLEISWVLVAQPVHSGNVSNRRSLTDTDLRLVKHSWNLEH